MESIILDSYNILFHMPVVLCWNSLIISQWRWSISSTSKRTHIQIKIWKDDWKCSRCCKSILPDILWSIYYGRMYNERSLL